MKRCLWQSMAAFVVWASFASLAHAQAAVDHSWTVTIHYEHSPKFHGVLDHRTDDQYTLTSDTAVPSGTGPGRLRVIVKQVWKTNATLTTPSGDTLKFEGVVLLNGKIFKAVGTLKHAATGKKEVAVITGKGS